MKTKETTTMTETKNYYSEHCELYARNVEKISPRTKEWAVMLGRIYDLKGDIAALVEESAHKVYGNAHEEVKEAFAGSFAYIEGKLAGSIRGCILMENEEGL